MPWVNFAKLNLIKSQLLTFKGYDTRAMRLISQVSHINWSLHFTSHSFNLHIEAPGAWFSGYNLKKGVGGPTAGLAHTCRSRGLIVSATHHNLCVNLRIIRWNWRNFLKRLLGKSYEK